MASAITGDSQGEKLILFASDSETSDFEGFDIDTMPLSFHACRIEDCEWGDEEEQFAFDEGSENEESTSDSSDDEEQFWDENIVPQTEIPFEQGIGLVPNLPADKKAIDFFQLFFTECLYRTKTNASFIPWAIHKQRTMLPIIQCYNGYIRSRTPPHALKNMEL